MGEPECVLQNELKALGGGFVCICDGEGSGVGEQRMFMCSSTSTAQMGFCLHLLVPSLQAKGLSSQARFGVDFSRHLFTSISLSCRTKILTRMCCIYIHF